MSKKLVLFLVVVVFLSRFNFAKADVVINEFVSHPNSGEPEWIELVNTGDPTNLSGWKLTELSSPSTNPKENDLLSLSGTINNFLVFEVGSSNLNDSGDSIGLYNGTTLVGRVTYGTDSTVKNYSINLAAPGAGKSGALISGIWETNQNTTKGTQNPTSSSSVSAPTATGGLVSTGTDINSSTSTTTATSVKNKIVEEPKKPEIKTQITGKTFGFVGIPISLQGTAFGLNGEQLHFGKYFWNFGDGDSKEVDLVDAIEPLNHAYFYPGEYVVSLDYFQNHYSNVPDASNQITIKIIPADIIISRIGDEKDFFIELSNNTDYNTDLSNWILAGDVKSFTIPHNTILSAKKKIIISPKITNFSIADKDTLKLMNGEGKVMFDYGASIVPAETVIENLPAVKPLDAPLEAKKSISEVKNVVNSAIAEIPTNNLTASTISSDIASNDNPNNSRTAIILIISAVFIGASAYGVYFIRQKRVVPQSGNDFEVLDE